MINVNICSLILFSALILSPSKAIAHPLNVSYSRSTYTTIPVQIDINVKESIKNLNNSLGLSKQKHSKLKSKLLQIWHHLSKKGLIDVTGDDSNFRFHFSILQNIIEQTLTDELQNSITGIKVIIHSTEPETNICPIENQLDDLISDYIQENHSSTSLEISKKRHLNKLLNKGASCYIAYPKHQRILCTDQQLSFYTLALEKYTHNLFDTPLNCEQIPLNLVGTTYIFKDSNNKTFVFSTKMPTFNKTTKNNNFILWLGSTENEIIKNRADTVVNFIKEHSIQESHSIN